MLFGTTDAWRRLRSERSTHDRIAAGWFGSDWHAFAHLVDSGPQFGSPS